MLLVTECLPLNYNCNLFWGEEMSILIFAQSCMENKSLSYVVEALY